MSDENKSRNGASGFAWFLIGLFPIPLWLVFIAAAKPPISTVVTWIILVITILCNLVGGIGCLGNVISNLIVRVIVGFFIAVFLFALTMIIAVFVGCITHPAHF